uniref:CID domain-containing protein n=1 Tax=Xiphophorus couchianus TaxID=32473 RepID=A0A3B5MLH5_9TELE
MMEDQAAREDACREYQSSLEDLTFNSKPHINMLTILAEENIQFAKDIVAIIEAQISKVFMIIAYFIISLCMWVKHGGVVVSGALWRPSRTSRFFVRKQLSQAV